VSTTQELDMTFQETKRVLLCADLGRAELTSVSWQSPALPCRTMDFAYTFGDSERLYLNVTNRCTCRCVYCVRDGQMGLGDGILWGGNEPDLSDLLGAIDERGGIGAFEEFVWCGFGEPTFRLDLIVRAGEPLRQRGARVRLNTNGHASLIHGRDVLPELARAVNAVSVSLNAPCVARYAELCRPTGEDLSADMQPEHAWEAMLEFLSGAPDYFEEVTASVVGHVLTPGEINAAEALARRRGATRFRIR
jgi:TatD family-associated radical SAM protein